MPVSTEPNDVLPARVVLRSLALPIYLPAVIVQTGIAMLLPILPLYLRSIDRTYREIGIILAAGGIGAMVFQLPIGRLLGRRSETSVMTGAVVAMAATTAVLGLVELTILLVMVQAVWGAGSTGWMLSRQTYMTRAAPPGVRGRAMALFGGTTRLSFLVGPIAGGFAADRFGFRAGFVLAALVTAAGLVPLTTSRRAQAADPSPPPLTGGGPTIAATLAEHWRMLAPMGTAQVLIITVRQGRSLVIPLIGAGIGLDAADVGLLVGIGTFTDFALFPLAGFVMDRFGRLAAIVPAFSLMGAGLLWLATVDSYAGIAGASALIGVGNSFGSGTMLTLSSDIAPLEAPSHFLAALGTIRDLGQILGPVVVGGMAEAFGLGSSAAVLGCSAFVAVAIFVFVVGETGPQRSRESETPCPLST